MVLGMEVGLRTDNFVLDEDSAPPQFLAISTVAKWLDASRCHLVQRQASAQGTLCSMGTQTPSPKRGWSPQFSAHVYCGQTPAWIKMPLGTEVGLGPGDIVSDGYRSLPPPKRG